MFVNKKKRKIPGINSSASADIAFLLLVFFLLTTSFDKTKGIYSKLAPPDPVEVKIEKEKILKRNLLRIDITSDNRIIMDNEVMNLTMLNKTAQTFILNPEASQELSESPEKHIIALRIDEQSTYETYISVLNELQKVYRSLRENYSQDTYGKSYSYLNQQQREIVRNTFPQKISEIIKKEDKP